MAEWWSPSQKAYLDLGAFLSFILFLGHHEVSDLPLNALPLWCFCVAQSLKAMASAGHG